MKKIGYTSRIDPEKSAKAIGRELPISSKASVEVCRSVRGKMVEDAVKFLEDVIALKRPINYRRYRGEAGHKKGKKFGPGKYPKKTAQAILDVIRHAQHNAEYKGLDSENMRIVHVSSSKGMKMEGFLPRAHGRSSPFHHETTNVEVVLEVVEE